MEAVTGKWSSDLADRMRNSGMSCHEMEKKEWEIKMYEKHIWICAFMAIGSKFRCTVGEVEKIHEESVRMLINELARTVTIESGVQFPLGIADRLCAYARSVGHFPTALKEQKWRNGYFSDITANAISRGDPDPSPYHTAILGSLNRE